MELPPNIDPRVGKTHAALFDTWFPLDELPIAPAIKPDIARIAAEVSTAMLAAFSQSSFLEILEGMTVPNTLPSYEGPLQVFICSDLRYDLPPWSVGATEGERRCRRASRGPISHRISF
jgi:hypothetical protein